MTNLNICIIDDDALFRAHLEQELLKFPSVNIVASCASVFEIIPRLESGGIHLLFLDIDMPDMNGIEFKRQFRTSLPTVFVSSHAEYAIEGFEVRAFDFIPKPVTAARLMATLQRTFAYYQLQSNDPSDDYIFLQQDKKYIKVMLKDIILAEADQDYTKIYTTEKTFLMLMRLRRLEEQISSGTLVRVHRSYLVNIKHIKEITTNSITLSNNQTIPLSVSFKESLHELAIGSKLIKR